MQRASDRVHGGLCHLMAIGAVDGLGRGRGRRGKFQSEPLRPEGQACDQFFDGKQVDFEAHKNGKVVFLEQHLEASSVRSKSLTYAKRPSGQGSRPQKVPVCGKRQRAEEKVLESFWLSIMRREQRHAYSAEDGSFVRRGRCDAEEGIRQGLDDVARGRTRPARKVFDEIR